MPLVTAGPRGELSPGDWAVLGLVAEGPTHGFAVARVVAPEGEIGRVWTMPRPLVYKALARLTELGLVRAEATSAGDRGPNRSIVAVTPAGRASYRRWLQQPVWHVRDTRSLLLLKLALIERSDQDPAPLVKAQLALLDGRVRALESRVRDAEGFERVLMTWRVESTQAVIRFLRAAY